MRAVVVGLVTMLGLAGCITDEGSSPSVQSDAQNTAQDDVAASASTTDVKQGTEPTKTCAPDDILLTIKPAGGSMILSVHADGNSLHGESQQATFTFHENVSATIWLKASKSIDQYSFDVQEKDGDGTKLAEAGRDVTSLAPQIETVAQDWSAGEYIVTVTGEHVFLGDFVLGAEFHDRLDCP